MVKKRKHKKTAKVKKKKKTAAGKRKTPIADQRSDENIILTDRKELML